MAEKKRIFKKGERYRPIVTVNKTKKNIPTVVYLSGRRYVYEPTDKF